jgi:hypothetical protein
VVPIGLLRALVLVLSPLYPHHFLYGSFFYPENEGKRFLYNINAHPPSNMVSKDQLLPFSTTVLLSSNSHRYEIQYTPYPNTHKVLDVGKQAYRLF